MAGFYDVNSEIIDSSEESAQASAAAAAASAAAAEASAQAAATSRNQAATSEGNASNSEANAQTYAQNAKSSENNATVSATEAEASANTALSHENKAQQWAEEPEDSEVESGRYSSLHWAAKSKESATSSQNSATNAQNSATNAQNSATNASTSEANASTSEANASTSETNSSKTAAASAVSATESSDSATKSEQWANHPYNNVVPNESEYSSKHYSVVAYNEAERARQFADALDAVLVYQGTWNPLSGTYPPDQPSGFFGTQFYIVDRDGTYDSIDWNAGDQLVWDSKTNGWSRVEGAAVYSVNGRRGVVVLDGSDLDFANAGTNLSATTIEAAIRELDGRAESSISRSVSSDYTILASDLNTYTNTVIELSGGGYTVTIPDYDAPFSSVIEFIPESPLSAPVTIRADGATSVISGDITFPIGSFGYLRLLVAKSKVWIPASGRYIGSDFSSGIGLATSYAPASPTYPLSVSNVAAAIDAILSTRAVDAVDSNTLTGIAPSSFVRSDQDTDIDARIKLLNDKGLVLPVGNTNRAGEVGDIRINDSKDALEFVGAAGWRQVAVGISGIEIVNSNTSAAANKGYIVDTTGGDVTITFPDSPQTGDMILCGVLGTGGNKIVIQSANPVMSSSDNFELRNAYTVLTFAYVNSTVGWQIMWAVGESEAPAAITTEIDQQYPAGTDTFNIDYDVGYVHVYVEGEKLNKNEFTANDGSTVVLATPLASTSWVNIVAFNHMILDEADARKITVNNENNTLTGTTVIEDIDQLDTKAEQHSNDITAIQTQINERIYIEAWDGSTSASKTVTNGLVSFDQITGGTLDSGKISVPESGLYMLTYNYFDSTESNTVNARLGFSVNSNNANQGSFGTGSRGGSFSQIVPLTAGDLVGFGTQAGSGFSYSYNASKVHNRMTLAKISE